MSRRQKFQLFTTVNFNDNLLRPQHNYCNISINRSNGVYK